MYGKSGQVERFVTKHNIAQMKPYKRENKDKQKFMSDSLKENV